ncbi:MAG: beta-galactosidase trimerization domain-containing protein, partial [Candidatus Omnitrophica bacterium]|nr:beta-galactosidase trimerization domain-containing protein [Candidatus Omnitrophota bacterium]
GVAGDLAVVRIVTASLLLILLSGFINLLAQTHPAQKYRSKNEPVIPSPDGTIFCEAEEFRLEGQWQAKNWGENYFAATFANTFLSRKAFLQAPQQCKESIATINVKIDEPGEYLVLVRYEAPYRFETQFKVRIQQDGKVLMDRLYGARENLKIWAFGQKLQKEVAWSWGAVENIVWEGHDASVSLKSGTAKISLIAGPQPEPAAKRNIDLVMLTKDHQQVKTRIEKESYLPLDGWLTQAGDVLIKVKNTASEKIIVKNLKFQEHSPYWVHMRNWKQISVSVEPGHTTEWIEVGSTMDCLNDGQWGFNATGSCIIEFGVRQADGEIEKIREFSLQGPGNLELVGFADTRYSRKIQSPDESIKSIVEYLKNFKTSGKTPEKTLIFAQTKIKEFPEIFGLVTKSDIYVDWRGKSASQLEAICQTLSQKQRENIRVVSLGDEIGLPAPDAKASKEGFVEYLKSQNVDPSEIDPSGDWNNISYNPDPKLKEANPAGFYWSQKYRNYYGIRKIKELTDVLRKYLPNAGIGANFSPHHGGYAHSYLGEIFQWVNCFREDGLTMPWSEDYIWQIPVGSPQMNEINLDLFRCGLKGKPDRLIHYYVMPHWPGNTPNMWKRQFYAAIAHGAKIFNLFEFQPVWLAYTENHVTSLEMYQMILKSFREYGTIEDIIQNGSVRNAETALWFSETADIWNDNDGSFAAGKRTLYIAIRNNQIPLDFIVEQDALDGAIDRYKTIFITDRHISNAASKNIAQWVKNGGILFLTAGAGMFDEYNRENRVFSKLLGFQQEIFEPAESRVEFEKQDLPFAKSITSIVEMNGSKVSIPVYGAICRVKPDSSSHIVARFSDGSAAILVVPYGKGKVIYCAFLPGLSFFKPAIPKIPVDRGSTDDAMAHFLPVDFERNIGKLVNEAYSGKPVVYIKDNKGSPVGFIENTVIEAKEGIVIPVINWSNKNIEDAVVELNIGIKDRKVSLASGRPIKKVHISESKTEISFDIEIADAIVIR